MFDNSTGIIQECYLSMIVVTTFMRIIHVCSLMNVPAGTNALYDNAHSRMNDSFMYASLIHGMRDMLPLTIMR